MFQGEGLGLIHESKDSPSGCLLDIPGASQVEKGERRRSHYVHGPLFFWLLLYTSNTWDEVRQCVFHRCIGRENVVEIRSPLAAVHLPHAYTVTGSKARAWITAAVIPLLLHTAVYTLLLLWLRGSAFERKSPQLFSIVLCGYDR